MRAAERTQVAVVGAGPAGLLLACLLERHGVETVILEARSRAYVEARIRAGVLEQGTRDVLLDAGLGDRMERDGLVHGGIYLRFDGESHHIPMSALTDGRTVTIYGQTEVVKDLIAARLASGDTSAVRVRGRVGGRPRGRRTSGPVHPSGTSASFGATSSPAAMASIASAGLRFPVISSASGSGITRSPGWGSWLASRPPPMS